MLSPASADFATAEKWMREGAASGWDGVVAKRLDCEYMSGERTGMVKIKRIRTADCVVGGFRWARGAKTSAAKPKNPSPQVQRQQILRNDQQKKSAHCCWVFTTRMASLITLVSAPALRGKSAKS